MQMVSGSNDFLDELANMTQSAHVRKSATPSQPPPPDLIPGLPYELAYQSLLRVPWISHCSMRMVCKEWRRLLQTPKFRDDRLLGGFTQAWICVFLRDDMACTSSWVVLDSELGYWSPLPSMPNNSQIFAKGFECRVAAGKLIVCGGYHKKHLNDVTVFDPTSNKWSNAAHMLSPRSHFVSGVIGERLYIAGGVDGIQSRSHTAECYDAKENIWYWLPALEKGISFCLGVTMGDNFFVQARGGEPKETLVFSPSFNLWSSLDTKLLCHPIIPHCVLDGMLYNASIVAGRYIIRRYKNETDSWTMLTTVGLISKSKSSAGIIEGLVAFDGKLWAITDTLQVVTVVVDRTSTVAYLSCATTVLRQGVKILSCQVLWA